MKRWYFSIFLALAATAWSGEYDVEVHVVKDSHLQEVMVEDGVRVPAAILEKDDAKVRGWLKNPPFSAKLTNLKNGEKAEYVKNRKFIKLPTEFNERRKPIEFMEIPLGEWIEVTLQESTDNPEKIGIEVAYYDCKRQDEAFLTLRGRTVKQSAYGSGFDIKLQCDIRLGYWMIYAIERSDKKVARWIFFRILKAQGNVKPA